MKPKILDLFCGGGAASKGYADAGFAVVGVDIAPQPNYPYKFVPTDALTIDKIDWYNIKNIHFLDLFDAIHASPPCQNYCWSTARHRKAGKTYPDLIEDIRELLIASRKPYVIENVPTAPLQNPTYLEGPMFGLGVIRRRCFETNWWLPQPMYIRHKPPIWQPRKANPNVLLQKSAYCSVAGHGAEGWSCRLADWQDAMGIDWLNRKEITQAIPPAYTEYIGKYLMGVIGGGR